MIELYKDTSPDRQMSETRCCCNCRHCIRIKDKNGMVQRNECEIDGHYIGYVETFEGWCRRWAKDHKFDEKGKNNGKD